MPQPFVEGTAGTGHGHEWRSSEVMLPMTLGGRRTWRLWPVFCTDPRTALPKVVPRAPKLTPHVFATPSMGMLMGDCDVPDAQVPLKPLTGPNGASCPADTHVGALRDWKADEAGSAAIQLPMCHASVMVNIAANTHSAAPDQLRSNL